MARPVKTEPLKLLGIWLPPEERWQIKEAAAARRMTLNQAVRQAMGEWIARSQSDSTSAQAPSAPASASTNVSAPQHGARPRRGAASASVADPEREAVLEYAAKVLRQTLTANAGKPSASRPRPTTTPPARPQANPQRSAATPPARAQAQAQTGEVSLPAGTPTRKAEPAQAAAAPARSKASFAWLRGAAGLDWSACPAVESHAAPDGARVWVFRGSKVTLKKVFRLLQEGHPSAKVGRRFKLDPEVFREVLRFAAQRLAPHLPGAQ